jgi:hypothetical protein
MEWGMDKSKPFQPTTNDRRGSVADDKLTPSSEMHILVGGPYTLEGTQHRYGHTAIRVKIRGSDTTYDFGRYGRVTGDFGAEGEGILRVWSNFSPYIAGENATGRRTTGFVFLIFDHQASAINNYYKAIIDAATPRPEMERGRSGLKVYRLAANYHALGYNCTTLSLDGAQKAIPNFEEGSSAFNKPEAVMTLSERLAMRTVGGGTPARIFLPANLETFLMTKPAQKPARVDTYGGTK